MTAVAVAALPETEKVLGVAGARAHLRVRDRLRRLRLERALTVAPEAEADVMVIDLAVGEGLAADASAFDGALLILTDDASLAADPALPGVLPLRSSDSQVAAAVAAVAEGLTVRGPAPREAAASGFAAAEQRPLLTPREVEILAQVGQGMSNKAIARRLGISAHTVKYHLEAIFSKLSVRSRAEAVTRGLRAGVLVV